MCQRHGLVHLSVHDEAAALCSVRSNMLAATNTGAGEEEGEDATNVEAPHGQRRSSLGN